MCQSFHSFFICLITRLYPDCLLHHLSFLFIIAAEEKSPHESVPEAPMPSWPTFPLPTVPLFLWTESYDIYASFLLDGFPTSPPHSYAPISQLLSLNAALFTAAFFTQSTGFYKWQFLVFSILFLNTDYLIRSKTLFCFVWNLLKCN